MPHRLTFALLLAGGLAAAAPALAAPASASPGSCVDVGRWYDGTGRAVAAGETLRAAAAVPAVLLGEVHDSAEDHRWQAQTLAALHAFNPELAVGLEMVPRSRQAALDRWAAGETGEAEFLREVGWDTVWGFDSGFYLPILHFARMHRLPLVALNVERGLVARTGREGWAAVPPEEREGVGDPAPVPERYLDRLAEAMAGHAESGDTGRDSPRFRRFVEAQSVWDRAMAERIAETHRATGRTIVGIMGAGHMEGHDGVPFQLAALGITGTRVLLPWDVRRGCGELDGRVADAVFAVSAPEDGPPRPRLGVMLEPAEGGVTVREVSAGSVASTAGLEKGDVVVAAAGTPVRQTSDLTGIVRRQAPGTWLPITVKRESGTRDLIAKFPAEP